MSRLNHVMAVISLLHKPPQGSTVRRFRNTPVLGWTLGRLEQCRRLAGATLLCWQDQLPAVRPIAEEFEVDVLVKDPRVPMADLDAVTAARRWSDGWRGGLGQTCDFDLGYHGGWTAEIVEATGADAVVLVDPSAGLVDPELIDNLIVHAEAHPKIELVFSQTPPGLGGLLMLPSQVQRLASARINPGRVMHYLPEQPMRDPIATESCAAIPTSVARCTENFRLDSDRQIARLTEAFECLNGTLATSGAEELVARMARRQGVDPLPREVTLELTTQRASRAIFRPKGTEELGRAPMSADLAQRVLEELGVAEDTRLTIAGVGDPLLNPIVFDVIAMAKQAGIEAVHLETDLLCEPAMAAQLAAAELDVLSVHLPAMTASTYQAVMGVEKMGIALQNVAAFAQARAARKRGVPLLAPTFTKCRANLAEMEAWYDQWLRAVGSAVILGPSDFAGQIVDSSVADMSPPRRRPCSRLNRRMTILCDGTIVACEQDFRGLRPVGRVGDESIEQIWVQRLGVVREGHARGTLEVHPLCGACREWHRV